MYELSSDCRQGARRLARYPKVPGETNSQRVTVCGHRHSIEDAMPLDSWGLIVTAGYTNAVPAATAAPLVGGLRCGDCRQSGEDLSVRVT